MKILLAALLFVTLSSCGKFSRLENGGFTEVTFHRPLSATAAPVITGGIFIYAYSDGYVTNLKIANEENQATISLPNGGYSFYAFGWQGDPSNQSTNMKCAVTGDPGPIALQGAAQTVNLQFSNSHCSNGSFSQGGAYVQNNSSTYYDFARPSLKFCGTSLGTTFAGGVSTSTPCTSTSAWTEANAVQAVVPIFRSGPNGEGFVKMGEGYRAQCHTNGGMASGSIVSFPFRFPVGHTSRAGAFPIEFEVFSDSSCASAPIAVHRFHKGLIFGPHPSAFVGDAAFTSAISTTSSTLLVPYIFMRKP